VEKAGAYASILLDRAGGRLDDPRELALLHRIVLGVLRSRAALDHAIGRVAARPIAEIDPELRVALWIGAYGLFYLDRVPEFAAVTTAVELVKRGGHPRGAGFVNGVLRSLARQGAELLPSAPEPGDVEGLALFHSHPLWWTERAVARWGFEEASSRMALDNEPAQPVLHANSSRTTAAELISELRGAGVQAEAGRFAAGAVRVVSGNPHRVPALTEGRAWPQDEASQLVGDLLGVSPGQAVLDCCAAPGAKTLQFAERQGGNGLLVATDRHAGRLGRLRAQFRGLGFGEPRLVQADGTARTVFRRRFDRVLVDAPCSGTGTLRRHPEIRWRLSPGDLSRLAERQFRLLLASSSRLSDEGRLVFSTCSVEPEEGERVVERFLEEQADFRRIDAASLLPAACAPLVGADGALRTSPVCDGMDGFFAAALVRR